MRKKGEPSFTKSKYNSHTSGKMMSFLQRCTLLLPLPFCPIPPASAKYTKCNAAPNLQPQAPYERSAVRSLKVGTSRAVHQFFAKKCKCSAPLCNCTSTRNILSGFTFERWVPSYFRSLAFKIIEVFVRKSGLYFAFCTFDNIVRCVGFS